MRRHVSTTWTPTDGTNDMRIDLGDGLAIVYRGRPRSGVLHRILRWLRLSPRTWFEAGRTYTVSYWTRQKDDRTILLDGVMVTKA